MAAIIAGFFGVILTRLFWGHQSTIISYLFFALLFTGVLGVSAIANAGSLLYRLLCMPWLRYIGKISYGLYLIHIPADLAVQLIMRRVAGPGAMSRPILLFLTVAALLLAVGVESVLWRYVEVPLLRLKRHFSAKRPLAELSTACGIAR
jgi:peptidoglycan/LPS O-acetylase OafA/YrhL